MFSFRNCWESLFRSLAYVFFFLATYVNWKVILKNLQTTQENQEFAQMTNSLEQGEVNVYVQIPDQN